MDPDQMDQTTTQLTTGAGIAIAGIWLAAAGINIVLLCITFVRNQPKASTQQMDGFTALVTLLILASPMIAAWSMTKRVLGQHDD